MSGLEVKKTFTSELMHWQSEVRYKNQQGFISLSDHEYHCNILRMMWHIFIGKETINGNSFITKKISILTSRYSYPTCARGESQPFSNSLLGLLVACHSSLSTANATKPSACLPAMYYNQATFAAQIM
jgi:hypothetical protein